MILQVLCSLVLFFTPQHDFHTSWMTLTLNEEKKEMETEWRTDTEHFEHVLSKFSEEEIRFDMTDENTHTALVQKYIDAKLNLGFNRHQQRLVVEIVEVDVAEVKITFKPIKCRKKLKRIEMTNTLLIEQFPGQKNMVQINYKGQQLSYVFQVGKTSFSSILNK